MSAALLLLSKFALCGVVVLVVTWCVVRTARRASCATREAIVRAGMLAAALAPWIAAQLPLQLAAVRSPVASAAVFVVARSSPLRVAAPAETSPHRAVIDDTVAHPTADPTPWILGLWSLGCAIVLARRIFAFARARCAVRALPRLDDDEWRTDTDSIATLLGVRRTVELRTCDERVAPYVFGLVRCTIVVPRVALGWSRPRRRAILAHELAHVERNDPAWMLVLSCVVALRWFDPLAWRLERLARALREHACDDRALDAGVAPTDLAHALWSTVHETLDARTSGAVAGSARRSTLAARVEHCLRIGGNRRRLSASARGLATATVLALGVAIAADGAPADTAVRVPLTEYVQSRWTDGALTVGAFLRGDATIDDRSFMLTALPPESTLVVFAVDSDTPTMHTWIATNAKSGGISWRSFEGAHEVRTPMNENAVWRRVERETMRRVASAIGVVTPAVTNDARVSGSTIKSVTATSSDPNQRVVQTTFTHDSLRIGSFSQDGAWSAMVIEHADGSQSIAMRGKSSRQFETLAGRSDGVEAIATECARRSRAALDFDWNIHRSTDR